MNKFAAFGVSDEGISRMTFVNPNTDKPYIDKDGKEAWIDVHHFHGPEGRAFDLANERKPINPRPGFTRENSYNIAKMAALTKAWYLVGADGEPIANMPCNETIAAELYENRWVFGQVLVHATAYVNFTPAKLNGS